MRVGGSGGGSGLENSNLEQSAVAGATIAGRRLCDTCDGKRACRYGVADFFENGAYPSNFVRGLSEQEVG